MGSLKSGAGLLPSQSKVFKRAWQNEDVPLILRNWGNPNVNTAEASWEASAKSAQDPSDLYWWQPLWNTLHLVLLSPTHRTLSSLSFHDHFLRTLPPLITPFFFFPETGWALFALATVPAATMADKLTCKFAPDLEVPYILDIFITWTWTWRIPSSTARRECT